MKKKVNNENSIFIDALTGSLLFILAICFTAANFSNIAMFEGSYTAIAAILAMSSISLLYKAIKNDNARLRQMI